MPSLFPWHVTFMYTYIQQPNIFQLSHPAFTGLTCHVKHVDKHETLKKTSKLHITAPLWGEFTDDRWSSLPKGQSCRKCFLFMMSWCWICHLTGEWVSWRNHNFFLNYHNPAQQSWWWIYWIHLVHPSASRRHVFRSVTQVCFGISISNFICMFSVVAKGLSLFIFSDVMFKMTAL